MEPSAVRDAKDSSKDPSGRRPATSVEDQETVQSTRVTATGVNIADSGSVLREG